MLAVAAYFVGDGDQLILWNGEALIVAMGAATAAIVVASVAAAATLLLRRRALRNRAVGAVAP